MVDNRGVTVAAATRDRAGVLKSTVQLRGDAVRAPPTAGFRIDSNHLSDSRCPLQYWSELISNWTRDVGASCHHR